MSARGVFCGNRDRHDLDGARARLIADLLAGGDARKKRASRMAPIVRKRERTIGGGVVSERCKAYGLTIGAKFAHVCGGGGGGVLRSA